MSRTRKVPLAAPSIVCRRACFATVLLFALFVSPLLANAQAIDPPKLAQGSTMQDTVRVTFDRVRMRDGVELAVRITRPEAAGKFPTVLAYSPYRRLSRFKNVVSEHDYSNITDGPAWLASQGYIAVNYDVRGTGSSGGASTDMYADAERQDGYDMVEWIARQPWSNGRVGMWGLSYAGVATWQVAAMAPPHLKAVVVADGTDDVYGDWTYPGGLPRPFVFGPFSFVTAFNFAPPDPEFVGADWASIWEEHLRHNIPWTIAFLKHQTDDSYWRARSVRPDYARIKCPVFVIGGWNGWYASALLRAFSGLKVPRRALIGPWGHSWPEDALPGPRIDARPEYLAWFGQFLKGEVTGALKAPPLILFVSEYQSPAPMYKEQRGFWRYEREWPLARRQDTSFYMGSRGELRQAVESGAGHDEFRVRPSSSANSGLLAIPWAMPLDQRPDEIDAPTYTSSAFETNTELTGTPEAVLFVASSHRVAYFHVRLCDVAPDGTTKLISDGGLNAAQRASRGHPEALNPGEISELHITLKSLAYVVPAGHRIRVDISSADFQNAWPISQGGENSVWRGGKYPSRVVLPVVPKEVRPQVTLLPSPNPLPEALTLPEKAYTRLERDPARETTTLTFGDGVDRSTYIISDRDPARATLKSDAEVLVPGPEGEVKVTAHTVTVSDATVFRHLVEVEITIDGKPHFSKSWTVSIPRVLN